VYVSIFELAARVVSPVFENFAGHTHLFINGGRASTPTRVA
jgi:hypothetical protein